MTAREAVIRVGGGLNLDARKFCTEVVAALGSRGSGKSNVMALAAEQLLRQQIPVIILDYVGIWWSLRMGQNEKPSGIDIPVLGGLRGDLPLTSTAGRLVAESLAANGSAAVLDISLFNKSERVRFAADFGEAFFQAKKRHKGPVFVILEEAQRFVPEHAYGDHVERVKGAFAEIAEVGRNYGIGLGLLSQRPQKLAKDVLNLANVLFAFQLMGLHERKAVSGWVQEVKATGRDQVIGELPGLDIGHAIVWAPRWGIYKHVKIDRKTTYDAGATPFYAQDKTHALKPLDLGKLQAAMTAMVEESKANDPAALRKRIKELEGARPSFDPELKISVDRLRAEIATMRRERTEIASLAQRIVAAVGAGPQVEIPSVVLHKPTKRPVSQPPVSTGDLLRREQEILDAVASLGEPTKNKLALYVGMAAGAGGFNNYLSSLRTKGYIEAGNPVRLTDAGRQSAGEADVSWEATWERWRPKLPTKCIAIVEALHESGKLSYEDLAAHVDMTAGAGGFNNYLSKLRTSGLIEASAGWAKLSEDAP